MIVAARFYNAPLFAWEPLIEPFEIEFSMRSGGVPAVAANLNVADTLNVNVSDTMLRAAVGERSHPPDALFPATVHAFICARLLPAPAFSLRPPSLCACLLSAPATRIAHPFDHRPPPPSAQPT